MPFGERLRQRREELRLSQRELARRTGVPQSTLSELEREERRFLTPQMLRALARTLGVTTDWLVGMYEDGEELVPAGVA